MKNFNTIIDEIYEFFDEVLGSIIPGLYFCSYPLFLIFLFIYFSMKSNISSNVTYITISLFVLSYVLGTMFRRSNSREPDSYSAKYTYFNSIPHDDNDFAFAKLIKDEDYLIMVKCFHNLVNNERIRIKLKKYEWKKIKDRQKRLKTHEKIFKIFNKEFNKDYSYCSKPEIQYLIYDKLNNRLKKISNSDNYYDKEECALIERFIKIFKLKEYCEVYTDYPYSNLKGYLNDRNMNNLVKYVDWEFSSDSKITARSKSLICNIKLYIRHFSPKDYGILLKTEAHIRFMNSIWYANKYLTILAAFLMSISVALYMIIYDAIFYQIKEFAIKHQFETIWNFIYNSAINIRDIIFGEKFSRRELGMFIFFVFVISLIYLLFGLLIKKAIISNYHYQRIREIVSVLYLYDLLQNDKDNQNDSNLYEQTLTVLIDTLINNSRKK